MSPVFDEAKYRALLEKLEVSEVNLNDLEFSWRIDAEYYQKHFLAFEKLLRAESWKYLSDLSSFLIGPFGSAFDTENYLEIGKYRYVRGQDVKPFILKDDDLRFIPEDDFIRLGKYALKENDVLVSVVGTIGNACIVQSKDIPAIFSCKSSVVRIHQGHSPAYVLTYLNCSYGKSLLLRKERGALQKGLNLDDLKSTIIPIFTDELEKHIEKIFWTAQKLFQKSKDVFTYAGQLLLQELGLIDWQPDDESMATKTFADFQNSGRLDAEYYQPKYQAIAEKLTQYSNGTVSCANILANAMTKLTSGTEYCYLELADIGKSGEINSCTQDVAENLPSRARQKVKTNDVIVSSVEGSLASCALITEEFNNAICSTGFHVLRSAEINPETLLLLMKSTPIQALLKQGCSGTILTAILPDALKAIKLPLIRKEVQNELAAKVQESFALRKESKRLLDLAKNAVEVAIEQGEDAAMKLLEN